MPSPFPGVDPYLEASDLWPDLHDALAAEIRAELNRTLPAPYYARLEMRPEVGIVENGGGGLRVVPDVSVARTGREPAPGATVLLEPRREASPALEVTVSVEPIRHPYLEVRDPRLGHRLVTLVEIASPSNKRPGVDRRAYERKQREVLDSDASLVELDLLRAGERLLPNLQLTAALAELRPRPDYLVTVNRAWRRLGDAMAWQIFPFSLRDPLPCIPVPLREGEAEPLLDLQWVFARAYDTGPYQRGAVDYRTAVPPPSNEELARWAARAAIPRVAREIGLRPALASALEPSWAERPWKPRQHRRRPLLAARKRRGQPLGCRPPAAMRGRDAARPRPAPLSCPCGRTRSTICRLEGRAIEQELAAMRVGAAERPRALPCAARMRPEVGLLASASARSRCRSSSCRPRPARARAPRRRS